MRVMRPLLHPHHWAWTTTPNRHQNDVGSKIRASDKLALGTEKKPNFLQDNQKESKEHNIKIYVLCNMQNKKWRFYPLPPPLWIFHRPPPPSSRKGKSRPRMGWKKYIKNEERKWRHSEHEAIEGKCWLEIGFRILTLHVRIQLHQGEVSVLSTEWRYSLMYIFHVSI